MVALLIGGDGRPVSSERTSVSVSVRSPRGRSRVPRTALGLLLLTTAVLFFSADRAQAIQSASAVYQFNLVARNWTQLSRNYFAGYVLGMTVVTSQPTVQLAVAGSYRILQPCASVQDCSASIVQNLGLLTVSSVPGSSQWSRLSNYQDAGSYSGINTLVIGGALNASYNATLAFGGSNMHPTDCSWNSSVCDLGFMYPYTGNLTNGTLQYAAAATLAPGGDIRVVQPFGDYLYVGGSFTLTTPSGMVYNNYAVYDLRHDAWVPLPSPTVEPQLTFPTAMAVNGNRLWAGDQTAPGYSRLNYMHLGGEWQVQTGLISGVGGIIYALAFNGSDMVFVGGDFQYIDGRPFSCVARFIVSTGAWLPLSSPTNKHVSGGLISKAVVFSMAATETELVVAGRFQDPSNSIAMYNYSLGDWQSLIPFNTPQGMGYGGIFGVVHAVVVVGRNVYAGVWEYAAPAVFSLQPLLYVLGSLAFAVLLVMVVYFMVLWFCPPADPRHERVAQWFTSILVLICIMVVGSIVNRVGLDQQIALSPGYTIEQATKVVQNGYIVQWLVALFTAPVFGYFSNLYSTRRLLAIALGFAVVATAMVLWAFVHVIFAYINFVFTGLAFGADFVVSLAYYSRSSSAGTLVGPVLAFFFFGLTFADILTRLTEVMMLAGAMRPDWVTHSMFQIAVTIMTLLLVLFGFREQPLRAEHSLPLAQQMAVPWKPVLLLLGLLFTLQLTGSAFSATPRFLIHDMDNLVAFVVSGLFMAMLLLVLFYTLAVWGTSPRRLSVAGIAILAGGYIFVVASLLTLATQSSNYPLIGSQPERVPFLLGAILVYGAGNILYAVVTSLYVNVLTQTSKGLMIGIFVALLGAGQLIGPLLVTVLLQDYNFNLWVLPVLMGVLAVLVVISLVALVRNYEHFVPNILIPFMPSTVRLLPSLLREELAQAGGPTGALAVPLLPTAHDVKDVHLSLGSAAVMGTSAVSGTSRARSYHDLD